MKDLSKKPFTELRKQHNLDLLRRMRSGESLTSFDSRASWYPPRPVIQKDRSEMARVYDAPSDQTGTGAAGRRGNVEGLRVLTLSNSSGAADDATASDAPHGEAS